MRRDKFMSSFKNFSKSVSLHEKKIKKVFAKDIINMSIEWKKSYIIRLCEFDDYNKICSISTFLSWYIIVIEWWRNLA